MGELFAGLASWVTSTIQTGGYVGIALLTLLENLFPPIPSELILPVAGALVSQGQLGFGWVVVAATLGSLAGALIFYGLGYWLGERGLRAFVRSHGRWFALRESDLEQSRDWFNRHGAKVVLFGRLVPSLRSVISIPAGVQRMPLGQFVLYTTLGSAVWNVLLVAGGWVLRDQWHHVSAFLEAFGWGALILLAAVAVWFIWRRQSTPSTVPD